MESNTVAKTEAATDADVMASVEAGQEDTFIIADVSTDGAYLTLPSTRPPRYRPGGNSVSRFFADGSIRPRLPLSSATALGIVGRRGRWAARSSVTEPKVLRTEYVVGRRSHRENKRYAFPK